MERDQNKLPQMGIDIESMARFRKILEDGGESFLNRLFAASEQQYCQRFMDPVPHFLGLFCAKEAVIKAMQDHYALLVSGIEIGHHKNRAPYVCKMLYQDKEIQDAFECSVSISHCEDYATAVAMIRKK